MLSFSKWYKKHSRNIVSKWLITNFFSIVVVLLILEIVFLIFVRLFFISGIKNNMKSVAGVLNNMLNDTSLQSTQDFEMGAKDAIKYFSRPNDMEITIFNHRDEVIDTTSVLKPKEIYLFKDFIDAKTSSDHRGDWKNLNENGERVMAITHALYRDDIYIGSIRYVVSIEGADTTITVIVMFAIILGLLIVISILYSSLYFIRSIITPVREISSVAKEIAKGNFKVKIEKKSDDEIGELCDSINDMALDLSEAEKLKNDFISSISHELRTPLTSIKGWAETIEVTPNLEKDMFNKGMHIIVKEADRLKGLVEDLLDFSRLQNGKMILRKSEFDINYELTEVAYMMKKRIEGEDKKFIYDKTNEIYKVMGDRDRLTQVFLNVIDNAIKYTDAGDTIEITCTKQDNFVCVIVKDSGCGISKEHLPHVKEKFYKANQTKRGSGIGLALVNEIVVMHKGELLIDSEEGVGTTVTIKIPLLDKVK